MAQAQYMEDLRGFVLDEERIVTYKWLSNSLSVSANAAKRREPSALALIVLTPPSRILHSFVEENKDKVTATYFVHAEQNVDGKTERHFTVVREDQLEGAKHKFSKVLSSHVFRSKRSLPPPCADSQTFSVSKRSGQKTLCASSVLWSIDYEANEELYQVRCPWAPFLDMLTSCQQADWKVLNSLRDNRYGHVKSKKIVRDLQPRREFLLDPGVCSARFHPDAGPQTELFPVSPGGHAIASPTAAGNEPRSAERTKGAAQTPTFVPKKEEAKEAEKPVKQEAKLSAAELR